MGIYVKLETQTFPLRDIPMVRLEYASELIRFFYDGKIFFPNNIEIWRGPPSESLGGRLTEKFPKEKETIADPFRLLAQLRKFLSNRELVLDQLLSSVIVINGIWDFDGIRFAGFLSINNNDSWRRVYRDIEMDAYGRGEIEDLVDVLWKLDYIKSMINQLVKRIDLIKSKQPIKPHEIFFTTGVPVYGEPENLMAVHFLGNRDLIKFYYSTLSKQGDRVIKDKMRPLKGSFVVGAIADHRVAQRKLQEGLKEHYIEEIHGNSVTYIAKEPNSFTNLYKQLYDTVFKPAMKELPKAKDVKLKIAKGLENLGSLD
jgi:hypothetical protein